MTRGDVGAVPSQKKKKKKIVKKMGFCLLLRCGTNSLLQDDMDASRSRRGMDEYGGLLNRGKHPAWLSAENGGSASPPLPSVPASTQKRATGSASLGLTQDSSCPRGSLVPGEVLMHKNTHPSPPWCKPAFLPPPPFPCRPGETEAREGGRWHTAHWLS